MLNYKSILLSLALVMAIIAITPTQARADTCAMDEYRWYNQYCGYASEHAWTDFEAAVQEADQAYDYVTETGPWCVHLADLLYVPQGYKWFLFWSLVWIDPEVGYETSYTHYNNAFMWYSQNVGHHIRDLCDPAYGAATYFENATLNSYQ